MTKQLFKDSDAAVIIPTAAPTPGQKRKVYCSYGHMSEGNWIRDLGFENTFKIEDADVVVFGGGQDIDPGWYGEKAGRWTHTSNDRNRAEKADFDKVQELRKQGHEILSVGVCRGAQLGCVLSGGSLIQDVSNHHGTHALSTYDKKEFVVNSIHHQMLFPYNKGMDRKDYKILAWAKKPLSGAYLNGWDKNKWLPEGFKEIEVAYFIKTNFLAIQSHPEMMFNSERYADTVKWMQDLFLNFYNKKTNE